MSEELMKYIIGTLIERAATLKDDKTTLAEGRRFAYYEMLDIIKNRIEIYGEDTKDYGLDFDLHSFFESLE